MSIHGDKKFYQNQLVEKMELFLGSVNILLKKIKEDQFKVENIPAK